MPFDITSTEAAVADLRVHPENERIYGTKDSIDELINSIKEAGIRESIVITKNGEIISGSRRFRAAQKLGLDRVPIKVFGPEDEIEIQAAIVDYNSQRVKSSCQIAAEAAAYMRIEKERAARRRAASNSKNVLEKFPEEEKGTARDLVGKKLNMSGKTAEKAAKAAEASDALKAAGKMEEAAEMDEAINRGFDSAFKLGVEKGFICPPKEKATKQKEVAPKPKEAMPEKAPSAATPEDPFEDVDCNFALDLTTAALEFLEGEEAQKMSKEQKLRWRELLDEVTTARKALGI